MRAIIILLAAAFSFAAPAIASLGNSPHILFSQEIVSIRPDGTRYPSTLIDPASMAGVAVHHFDLGAGRSLEIHSNIANPRERGIEKIAEIVRGSYAHVEKVTGRSLTKGVLLYLIELDEIPFSYRFEASYEQDAGWGEVRLALVRKGETLLGPDGSAILNELLYDTIPHELGHDILSSMPCLLHDVDGEESNHTRWFIEGICENLAKGFAREAAPLIAGRYLSFRNVGAVLHDPEVRGQIFSWRQENGNGMALESDLYGASMLLLMAWNEAVEISAILRRLEADSRSFCGSDLVALMQGMTGLGEEKMLERAAGIGIRLEEETLLAANGTGRQGEGKGI